MPLAHELSLPFGSDALTAVAKVYRGNKFVQSGAFISPDGLFLTNFPIALEEFTDYTSGELNWLSEGFSASSPGQERPLPGVFILVPVEQVDVTHHFTEAIGENATNLQISQIKKAIAEELINKRKGDRKDLLVQVNEIHSGNRQLMVVYKILNDVRLVFAPPIQGAEKALTSNQELVDLFSDHFVLIRAYWPANKNPIGFSEGNVPFTPEAYLPITPNVTPGQPTVALGFPNQTYRQESLRALNYYQNTTNPYILKSYSAYLNKEEYLLFGNKTYGLKTLANRYDVASSIYRYKMIQEVFSTDSILEQKAQSESAFLNWVKTDTLRGHKYQDILYYIDQAYDIAEQQGASFYVTSYAIGLSTLDDLAAPFRTFLETDYTNKPEEVTSRELQSVLHTQQSLLNTLNVQAELNLLKDFILILNSLPEDSRMFSILSIFEHTPPAQYEQRADEFIARNGATSFLFNPQKALQVVQNNEVQSDSLYVLLDEILFTNQLARNNQTIFQAYLYPAQKIFTQAKLEWNPQLKQQPDANGTLRANLGFVQSDDASEPARFFISNNDFSGKAPGSLILNDSGQILGLIHDRATQNIGSNYLYQPENATTKAIKGAYILTMIEQRGSPALQKELGLNNN